jgi:hypothetical protein
MDRNSTISGRVVPQANNSSGGGRGLSRIIQAGIGAFTQARADEARTKREYESEVIKSAGHATRKEVDREHFQNVMQDVDIKNRAIKESGGLRFTGMSSTGFELEKTGNQGKTDGAKKIRKKPGGKGNATTASSSKRSKGGSIAATVGAIKSKKVDFEQATGGEFGDEAGISPKLTADFGAHAAAGGNQESYLNQFGPSGRRRRTKPPKPDTPPPPSGGGSGKPKKTAGVKNNG